MKNSINPSMASIRLAMDFEAYVGCNLPSRWALV